MFGISLDSGEISCKIIHIINNHFLFLGVLFGKLKMLSYPLLLLLFTLLVSLLKD